MCQVPCPTGLSSSLLKAIGCLHSPHSKPPSKSSKNGKYMTKLQAIITDLCICTMYAIPAVVSLIDYAHTCSVAPHSLCHHPLMIAYRAFWMVLAAVPSETEESSDDESE
jgi:hypothetical protein